MDAVVGVKNKYGNKKKKTRGGSLEGALAEVGRWKSAQANTIAHFDSEVSDVLKINQMRQEHAQTYTKRHAHFLPPPPSTTSLTPEPRSPAALLAVSPYLPPSSPYRRFISPLLLFAHPSSLTASQRSAQSSPARSGLAGKRPGPFVSPCRRGGGFSFLFFLFFWYRSQSRNIRCQEC